MSDPASELRHFIKAHFRAMARSYHDKYGNPPEVAIVSEPFFSLLKDSFEDAISTKTEELSIKIFADIIFDGIHVYRGYETETLEINFGRR